MTNTKTTNAKTQDPLPNLQPWEQQPGETPKHYNYFTLYKNIPIPQRSIKKVQETLQQQNKQLTQEYLRQVSAANKWQGRVSAWDKHMSHLAISSKEMNIKQMNDKHFSVGKTCINSLLDDINDPELLTVPIDKRAYVKQALIRGMEGAVRIQRLALGESTSNTKQVNEGINNLMMVLTDSKKQLQKQKKKEVIDIEGEVIQTEN
jgi:hypothetical protein